MGNVISGDEYDTSNQAGWAAQNAVGSTYSQIPKIEQMQINLQKMVQQGVLTPEMAETFLQEASAYEQMDPLVRDELTQTIESKGLDPQSRAALNQAQGQTQAVERGGREAILADAAARGVSGSGIEMASKMAGQQGAATNMANQGFQAAADANQRQMQAVGQLGAMDENKAAAQNAINQFNAANRQSVENMNVGTQNAAEAQNLAEKQRIADTNVNTANQQELYNKGLHQQDFSNKLNQSTAYANASLGQGTNANQVAQGKNAMSDKWSDKNLKTDIEEVDPDAMLEGLTGYSYKYKDDMGLPEGEQVGIVAQDLEEFAPQAVNDTPEGKTISYDKMGGPMLAALASLDERLREIEGDE